MNWKGRGSKHCLFQHPQHTSGRIEKLTEVSWITKFVLWSVVKNSRSEPAEQVRLGSASALIKGCKRYISCIIKHNSKRSKNNFLRTFFCTPFSVHGVSRVWLKLWSLFILLWLWYRITSCSREIKLPLKEVLEVPLWDRCVREVPLKPRGAYSDNKEYVNFHF
jgi:hypothetical protein